MHWRNTAIVGVLLLLGGNGGVMWAEQFVPSGMTALLVSVLPFWMVLLDWARPGGIAPSAAVVAGLVTGLAGVAVLIGPAALGLAPRDYATGGAGDSVRLSAAIVLILASLFWALGSIFSRDAKLPESANLATGMEMLCGGAAMLVAGLIAGEPMRFDPAAVSARSIWGFLYLLTFGSLLGFTAYIWLLKHADPAKVSTYAYVNPVVAVFLGWGIAGEAVSIRSAIAAAIIVGAVALITTARTAAPPPEPA